MRRRLLSILFTMLVFAVMLANSYAKDQVPEKAPNFTADAQWLDTSTEGKKVPHSIKGYHGQVLLIDFWEYTCINCIRDFAVLKRWYRKYHPYGFEIVGVHYAEFTMGSNASNVRDAAKRFQLPWPVVADPKGSIWRAYHSNVWPNRYLIDQEGDIVLHVEGETDNEVMEAKIRELLAKTHPEVSQIPPDPPENTFAPSCGIPTDETYVGDFYGRGAIANAQHHSDGDATSFKASGAPPDGKVMLSGRWTPLREGASSAEKHGEATLRYHARSVYAVLSVEDPKKPVRVYLLQDGKPLGQSESGMDVRFDSQGSFLEVGEPRMYYLVKNSASGSHLLTLEPQAPLVTLHSFTYGNDCQQNFEQR